MADIHAHAILDMMEGQSYTREELKKAIVDRFGADAHFCTCSASGMNSTEIVTFLEQRGKLVETETRFTVDQSKRCNH